MRDKDCFVSRFYLDPRNDPASKDNSGWTPTAVSKSLSHCEERSDEAISPNLYNHSW
jgi:hypothetical protein